MIHGGSKSVDEHGQEQRRVGKGRRQGRTLAAGSRARNERPFSVWLP
jgi:hypothetical protein